MTIDDEVRRATKLLETVMQAAGLTRKDLDQKLGAGPGYISQVLTGRMELKFRHILAILRALEVEPSVFFQTLYPEDRPGDGRGGDGGVPAPLPEAGLRHAARAAAAARPSIPRSWSG